MSSATNHNAYVDPGSPPKLTHDELATAQSETLAAKRRRYGVPARVLFSTLDLVYGKRRTLSKFKVLELIARVPYQSWEQTAYIAITQIHERTGMARRIYDRVVETRAQQDNEQWHLLILDEQITRSGVAEGRIKYFWIPQLIAVTYYQVSWLMYVVVPKWSYQLNADFEDHAEHEYAHLVAENPTGNSDHSSRRSRPTTAPSPASPMSSARSVTTSGCTRSRARRASARPASAEPASSRAQQVDLSDRERDVLSLAPRD